MEDDDVLADDGQLAHVAEEVQPGRGDQHRPHLVHIALNESQSTVGDKERAAGDSLSILVTTPPPHTECAVLVSRMTPRK